MKLSAELKLNLLNCKGKKGIFFSFHNIIKEPKTLLFLFLSLYSTLQRWSTRTRLSWIFGINIFRKFIIYDCFSKLVIKFFITGSGKVKKPGQLGVPKTSFGTPGHLHRNRDMSREIGTNGHPSYKALWAQITNYIASRTTLSMDVEQNVHLTHNSILNMLHMTKNCLWITIQHWEACQKVVYGARLIPVISETELL